MGILMANWNDERTGFIEAISWMGAPPYPLLFYTVCDSADEDIVDDIRNFWPVDADIDFLCLADNWPFEIALVEIGLVELGPDVDSRVRNTLESIASKRSTATCFMFEGGFADYQQLFNPQQQRSTFGICLKDTPAFVCTKDSERQSGVLIERLEQARIWLHEMYFQGQNKGGQNL